MKRCQRGGVISIYCIYTSFVEGGNHMTNVPFVKNSLSCVKLSQVSSGHTCFSDPVLS